MRDQRIDLVRRNALAFHVDLDAHVGEADRLLADIAGAPHRRDVEVALELELELVDDPAAVHGIGVQADRQAGAECGERGFRRIRRSVVAEQARRLVDDVGRKGADVLGMTEFALGHRLALQGLDHLGIGLAVGDELLQPALVDGREAACQHCFLSDRGHQFLSRECGSRTVCILHKPGQKGGKSKGEAIEAVSLPARGLISTALLVGKADAASRAIILSSGNMSLDDFAALRFTERMSKSAARKKRAFAPADDESARGRLLSAATNLFCKNGINATGIDAIIDEAGTAKTTLYKLFGSKTNPANAVLEGE